MEEVKYFWYEPVAEPLIQATWEAAFNRVLPNDMWSKSWNWRFKSNPASEVIHAAYILCDDEIACFYAVTPFAIVAPDGTEMKACLTNMGITNPKYQGKGYFIEMMQQMHDQLKQRGFDFIFGFSNYNSHYPCRKYLYWNDLAVLTNFKLVKENVSSRLRKTEAYLTNTVPLNVQVIEQLARSYVTQARYHIPRTASLLKWRILDNPTEKYYCLSTVYNNNCLAYAVYKLYGVNEADIMEIFYDSEELIAKEDILASMVSYFLNNGICAINLWSNLFSEEHIVLEKIGFREHIFSTHFGVIDFYGRNDLKQVANWHYRFLDSDVY